MSSPAHVEAIDPAADRRWPRPLGPDALHGIIGEFVHVVSPESEADPAGLVLQFLTAFGSVVGRGPHLLLDGAEHPPLLFTALVGASSKGRKGTALAHVRRLFAKVDPCWEQRCIVSGLASGEGIIHAVRDPKDGSDEGVRDKRLLIVETEFGNALRVMRREGSTLSPTLRCCWDGTTLSTLAKHQGEIATKPHVGLIAHVTAGELVRLLADSDIAGGLANRILWCGVRRSKLLPWGGEVSTDTLDRQAETLLDMVARARNVGRVIVAGDARQLWEDTYSRLSVAQPGLLGDVTSRSEAQAQRIALLFALLDGENVIRTAHLMAALEVWRYCEDSARYVFGDRTGDPIADKLRIHLRDAGEFGIDRSSMLHKILKRNVSADRLDAALRFLLKQGLVKQEPLETGGRSKEIWYSTEDDRNDTDDRGLAR